MGLCYNKTLGSVAEKQISLGIKHAFWPSDLKLLVYVIIKMWNSKCSISGLNFI